MTTPDGLWTSERLRFRAVEVEDDQLFCELSSDPALTTQLMPVLPIPRGKTHAKERRERDTSAMLSAIIEVTDGGDGNPIPIGHIRLSGSDTRAAIHRATNLAISIKAEHQGRGYGSEAIRWVMRWCFLYAGMHRLALGVVEYNPSAARLYERLGFLLEGRERDACWYKGRFWDHIKYSMLEDEWRKRYAGEES